MSEDIGNAVGFVNPQTEEEYLPFARAEVVRLMKENLDSDKIIRERVKVEMNKFLGKILKDICKQLNEYPYTRITEFKKMTGQKSKYTTILKEIPCFGGIEYYPYWTKEYIELANKYRELAKLEKNTYFLGRLGEYRYYDMDDAIRSALNLFQVIKETSGE